MNRQEWMRREIAAWRSEGVIGPELAEALSGRYAPSGAGLSWGLMLAGAFGALMVGLGVVALFAANWDGFGRGARAAIALAPVALCGGVALAAAWKGWRAMSLWEPLGIFWCIALGAAACLVAQTYQVGGSVPGFILFVALLCLPVVWITRAVAPMALWPIFGIAWGFAYESDYGSSPGVLAAALGLVALSLPAYVAFVRRPCGPAARLTGQLLTGFVYALGMPILAVGLLRDGMSLAFYQRVSVDIVVFWLGAASVLLAGALFRLPVWPLARLSKKREETQVRFEFPLFLIS